MNTFLTIDIGTTNWKVALFDTSGAVVALMKRACQSYSDRDGFVYYDPLAVWHAVCDMTSELLEEHSAYEVLAICVSSMGESVVPIDRNGNALFGFIPWFDNRSELEAADVASEVGANHLFKITGSEASPIYSLAKLLWIQKNAPSVFAESHQWLQMCDYVNYRLTKRVATDHSMASRTMAYDINACMWSADILKSFKLSAGVFPEIISSGELLGTVTKEAAYQTGLKEGTPVVMGGHDHPLGSIGASALGKNRVFNSSGTAEPYLYVSERGAPLPTLHSGQRVTRHPDKERYIVWGGIISSGSTIDWAVNCLAPNYQGDYDTLFAECQPIPPGSNGVLFQPHLRGSGAPWWDTRARGAFLGLTSRHTSKDLLRSVLEGLSFQSRLILEMHKTLTGVGNLESICCMGGGSRIHLWQCIKASITGCSVLVNPSVDATPLGAAMIAAKGIGLYRTVDDAAEDLCPELRELLPDNSQQSAYNELYELYKYSYEVLEPINHRLSDL